MSQRYVPLAELRRIRELEAESHVLRAHRLDPTSVAAAVREAVYGRA